jgi:hypothetical protein
MAVLIVVRRVNPRVRHLEELFCAFAAASALPSPKSTEYRVTTQPGQGRWCARKFHRNPGEKHACLPEHPGYFGEMVWILMVLAQRTELKPKASSSLRFDHCLV